MNEYLEERMSYYENELNQELQFYDEIKEFLLTPTGKLFLEYALRENSELLTIAQKVIDDKVNEAYIIKMDVYSGQGHADLGCDVPADVEQMLEDQKFLNTIN